MCDRSQFLTSFVLVFRKEVFNEEKWRERENNNMKQIKQTKTQIILQELYQFQLHGVVATNIYIFPLIFEWIV